jgi:F-type H+-transporting ATPase subunit epsilon
MLNVHIAKVNGILYHGEADSLTAPGSAGELTVLPNHIPLVTTLKPGRITIKKNGVEAEVFEVEKGILEVTKDAATVLL